MTVKELIEKLEVLNIPNAKVFIIDADSGSLQPVTSFSYNENIVQLFPI